MAAPRITLAFVFALLGCEAVTGLKDLEFEPEECESLEEACAGAACGSRTDNCGREVECPDTCIAPFACAVGGVGPNECGCTGGLSHATPITPPGCTSFLDATGHTYYQCGAGSFDEGREICRSFGTDLVVIKSPAENALVQTNMLDKSWIGLTDVDGCTPPERCEFFWVDGTPEIGNFTNWNTPVEPNNSTGGEFCVEMHKTGPDAGEWNDITCPNLLNIVCETTCPEGT